MNAIPAIPLTVTDEVTAFLKQHQLEEAFEQFCQVARECHPEILRQEAVLRDDVDEPGRQYVVVYSTRPKGFSYEESLPRRREFTRRVVEEFPFPVSSRFHQHFNEARD
jgi:hypothetical protein